MSTDLGVEWTKVENGIADVLRVSQKMIERFSKRAQEIRGALAEVTERINEERLRLGLPPVEAGSAKALNITARETRAAKLAHVATSDLRARWSEEARAAGLEADALAGVLDRTAAQAAAPADDEQQRRVAAKLTEKASTFGRRDAAQAVAAASRRGLPVAEVLERTSALLTSAEVIPMVGVVRDQDVIHRGDGSVAPVPTGERRWSTPEMLAVEQRLVASALGRQEDGVAVVPERVLRESLQASLRHLPPWAPTRSRWRRVSPARAPASSASRRRPEREDHCARRVRGRKQRCQRRRPAAPAPGVGLPPRTPRTSRVATAGWRTSDGLVWARRRRKAGSPRFPRSAIQPIREVLPFPLPEPRGPRSARERWNPASE